MTSTSHRVGKFCIALSFDTNMFLQAKQCIKTIHEYCQHDFDICALALGLDCEALSWLRSQGVVVKEDYSSLPRYQNFPLYGYSQICRPYLRELFPGYETYMWVDADIRFCHSDAFDQYIYSTLKSPESIAICQEVDNAYISVWSPDRAWGYHVMKNKRIAEIYGNDILKDIQYYYNFNTGIWAMHRDSEIWELFKEALSFAFRHEFNHMREQDAMNVAIVKWDGTPQILPATMNWLCGLSVPIHDQASDRYVQPQYPFNPVSVLHLIASNSMVEVDGTEMTWYQLYQKLGFTQ